MAVALSESLISTAPRVFKDSRAGSGEEARASCAILKTIVGGVGRGLF